MIIFCLFPRPIEKILIKLGYAFCRFVVAMISFLMLSSFIHLCPVPGAAPQNVRGRNTSSTSILVTWGEVPADQQHGGIINYTVIYKELMGGAEVEERVYHPKRSLELTQLEKYTKYIIQVLAATIKGAGPRSVPITVSTDQDSK